MGQNINLRKACINVITALVVIFSLVMAIIRNFYGIEITDEAFYVAESISILRGNAPFTFTMSDKPFFPVLLTECLRLYQLFVPDFEGVFLFSRTMFLAFRGSIIILLYILLRKEFNHNYLIFALCLLFTIWGERIPNLSYNTISCWMFILAGGITFRSITIEDEKKSFLLAGLTGAVISLGVLAHFGQLLNAVWFGGVYLLYGKGIKRWSNFFIYVLGGVGTLSIVLFQFSLKYGWNKFIFGVKAAFVYINRIDAPSFQDNLRYTLIGIKIPAYVFGFILLMMLLYRVVYFKQSKVFYIGFKDAILAAIFICMLLFLRINDSNTDLLRVGTVGFFSLLIFVIAAVVNKDKRFKKIIVTFMAFPAIYVIVFGFLFNTMAYKRFWMFDFIFFGGILLYERYYMCGNIMRRILCLLTFVLIFLFFFSAEWSCFYREKPLTELNTKVVEGVYKGIITTGNMAEDTQALEIYIKKVTNKEDRVLFLDNVPAGYMMSDAIPWTPSTWDLTAYSYGFNNPEILYAYFENRGEVPTKVIYVDYGRDEKMSIDDENYLLNKFINMNYKFIERRFVGDTYEIRLYEYQRS